MKYLEIIETWPIPQAIICKWMCYQLTMVKLFSPTICLIQFNGLQLICKKSQHWWRTFSLLTRWIRVLLQMDVFIQVMTRCCTRWIFNLPMLHTKVYRSKVKCKWISNLVGWRLSSPNRVVAFFFIIKLLMNSLYILKISKRKTELYQLRNLLRKRRMSIEY